MAIPKIVREWENWAVSEWEPRPRFDAGSIEAFINDDRQALEADILDLLSHSWTRVSGKNYPGFISETRLTSELRRLKSWRVPGRRYGQPSILHVARHLGFVVLSLTSKQASGHGAYRRLITI